MTETSTSQTAPLRILVIDDEEAMRRTLRDVLEEAGYEVSEAADGNEAFRVVVSQGLRHGKTHPVHVVITDIVMPEKEGYETIRDIHRGYPEISIIAISGHGEDYLQVAKVLGAERVLSKPFDAEDIVAAVRAVAPPSE